MRLARVVIPWDHANPNVEQLLGRWELDLLQLDLQCPTQEMRDNDSDGNARVDWPRGFIDGLRVVHKSLFLLPDMRVITNAGGGEVVGCMEALAEFLCEHGSADMPIAAVRGENLSSSIDDWMPLGVDFGKKTVLAAQVEIGAGPLATALVEGARIVVAGAYDRAAPFLAAAVESGQCDWQDYQVLANLAATSHLDSIPIEMQTDGTVELELSAANRLDRVREQPLAIHADLICDYSRLFLEPTERSTQRIAGAVGQHASGSWVVRMTLDAGYQATLFVETSPANVTAIQDFFATTCGAENFSSACYLQVDAPHAATEMLLKLTYRDQKRERCQQFLDSLQSWQRQNSSGTIAEPLPTIQRLTETAFTSIPVEQVTLAVDTRPAREWL